MSWIYKQNKIDEELLVDYTSFVYCITNITNGKMYIGKKSLKFKKTKVVKGKKKRSLIESDWKTYYGSNKNLHQDIELLGENNFKREILRLCKTKGEASYFETKYIFDLNVLISDNFYNEWVMCRINKFHLKKVNIF
jgi:hypothetical protein